MFNVILIKSCFGYKYYILCQLSCWHSMTCLHNERKVCKCCEHQDNYQPKILWVNNNNNEMWILLPHPKQTIKIQSKSHSAETNLCHNLLPQPNISDVNYNYQIIIDTECFDVSNVFCWKHFKGNFFVDWRCKNVWH